MRALVKFIVGMLLRVRVVGDLAPISAGKALVVANHDSLLDAALLGLFLPPRAWIVASREDMA
jgi:1-acyl-sn-glycerol-3-phosphate acyltransferase